MTTKVEQRGYEDAVSWLRDHGFDLIEAPGTQNRVFLKKYNVSAAIEKADDGTVKIFAYPGNLVGTEIAKQHAAQRPGKNAGEVEHAHAVERAGIVRSFSH